LDEHVNDIKPIVLDDPVALEESTYLIAVCYLNPQDNREYSQELVVSNLKSRPERELRMLKLEKALEKNERLKEYIFQGETKLNQKSLENLKLLDEIKQKQNESEELGRRVDELEKAICLMESSKFWKVRKYYLKLKFLFLYPDKFVIKYFRKIKYLTNSFVESYRKEGRKTAITRITNYIKKGKGTLNYVKNNVISDSESIYKKWIKNIEAKGKAETAKNYKEIINELEYKPKISLIVPVYNTDEIFLRKAIFSVINQYYHNWELCISDDYSTKKIIRPILEEFRNRDSRIKIHYSEKNGGIAAATNQAAHLATGDFLAFLDSDDELEPDALLENVLLLNKNKDADFIYSDDDKIDENGNRYGPQFKPDWSPELLLSYCYISHFKVVRKSLFFELGGLRDGFNPSQDYDFLLRMSERTDKIFHIPKILYHWRSLDGSTAKSANEKPNSLENGRRVLEDTLSRRKINGQAIIPKFASERSLGIYKIKFNICDNQPKITIIIPTKDSISLLQKCINSIKSKTAYRNYEILVINNNSSDYRNEEYLEKEQIKYINIKTDKFNFSEINNIAVDHSDSELILFLNNDTEVISRDWLTEMVCSINLSEKIGAVGARLIFANDKVQHAGIILGLNNLSCGHANKLINRDELGYLGYNLVMRNYSAVTGACMLTKKSLFEKVGGLDEKNLAVAYNDVDYCLKLIEEGYRIVYNPAVLLYHNEGSSRGFIDNMNELEYFKNKWRGSLLNDKYYNINLSLYNEKFEIKTE
jgi:GT2 family glycosyltransferase